MSDGTCYWKVITEKREKEVLGFIGRFTRNGQYEQVIDTFAHGCCAWFAIVLAQRFAYHGAWIMYDQVDNHFGVKIGDRVYDITGDVTGKYSWEPWDDLEDDLLVDRIIRDCINFAD